MAKMHKAQFFRKKDFGGEILIAIDHFHPKWPELGKNIFTFVEVLRYS